MNKLLFKKPTPKNPQENRTPEQTPPNFLKNQCCQHIEWSQLELKINQQQF